MKYLNFPGLSNLGLLVVFFVVQSSISTWAQGVDITDETSLNNAITSNSGETNTLQNNIFLSDTSVMIDSSNPTIITGNQSGIGTIINMGLRGESGTGRIFFVQSGELQLSNLTLEGGVASGGSGAGSNGFGNTGAGGGGGLGAGGAVFVRSGASLVLNDVQLINNTATGGDGGDSDTKSDGLGPGNGGGGLGGIGGSGASDKGGGGGGGTVRRGDNAWGGVGNNDFFGTNGGNGGGLNGGSPEGGDGGEFGGGAGGLETSSPGGSGGFGGGGGGSGFDGDGGNGGYGGGGGGAYSSGGNGGFGGGGGAGQGSGTGGYGGGDAGDGGFAAEVVGGAGGGAGFGGAIYVQDTGTVSITDGSFSGNSVNGGAGGSSAGDGADDGQDGRAAGAAVFLEGRSTLNYTVSDGNTVTITDSISSDSDNPTKAGSSNLNKQGAGTLILSDTMVGITRVQEGTLELSEGSASSGAMIVEGETSTLRINGTMTGDANVVDSGTLEVNGTMTGDAIVDLTAGLSGSGTIDGNVSFNFSSAEFFNYLNPGNSPGTLTINQDLDLVRNTIITFELGELGKTEESDFINVLGDLTLDGILEISPLGGFEIGSYKLFSYGGMLTDNGLEIAASGGIEASIELGGGGEVQLVVTAIPEPNTVGLLGLALVGWCLRRRSS